LDCLLDLVSPPRVRPERQNTNTCSIPPADSNKEDDQYHRRYYQNGPSPFHLSPLFSFFVPRSCFKRISVLLLLSLKMLLGPSIFINASLGRWHGKGWIILELPNLPHTNDEASKTYLSVSVILTDNMFSLC
jgi:hypothetical protein